nr:LARD3 [cloning vector pDART]
MSRHMGTASELIEGRGSDGNDLIQGGKGADFIEGGKGNDTIRDNSGHNTFLFSGHFGQDRIIGYQPTDRLVFQGADGSTDLRDHAKAVGADTVLSFGADSVTLVGVGLGGLWSEGVLIS